MGACKDFYTGYYKNSCYYKGHYRIAVSTRATQIAVATRRAAVSVCIKVAICRRPSWRTVTVVLGADLVAL